MALPNPVQAPLTAIVRATPEMRVAEFQKNSRSIYNKFPISEATGGGIGFDQPYVYTKLTDSNAAKNLTKYDSQAFPIGSTVRDLERIGKFMASGRGAIFTTKQFFLQNQNPFNETRIYNPLSVLKATGRTGTAGLVGQPVRYVETSGGILNFFKNSLLSTIGAQADQLNQRTISGTAKGDLPNYSAIRGGARAGLLRYNTALTGVSRFTTLWPSVALGTGTPIAGGTGFLTKIGSSLKNTLSKAIPSTNPQGIFGGKPTNEWEYRPEYPIGRQGIYNAFLDDPLKIFGENRPSSADFYNQAPTATTSEQTVRSFHRFYPASPETSEDAEMYASPEDLTNDGELIGNGVNLVNRFEQMVNSFEAKKDGPIQSQRSREMYNNAPVANTRPRAVDGSYSDIPGGKGASASATKYDKKLTDPLTLDSRAFAKTTGVEKHDVYNAMEVFGGKRGEVPDALLHSPVGGGKVAPEQSKDVIFFYLFDLVNEKYIPFRATVSGISEQNSADWEEVTYIGRADKLFLYRGFSRDLNLIFSVYANSVKELIPMWKRIDYLTGLTRPAKYTSGVNGALGQFIYPPMVTLRLGDMYNDQPCVITNVGLNIPDDTNWETFRTDNEFRYLNGLSNEKVVNGVKSRQLPLKVDVTLSMKLLEKQRSETNASHYGFNDEIMPASRRAAADIELLDSLMRPS